MAKLSGVVTHNKILYYPVLETREDGELVVSVPEKNAEEWARMFIETEWVRDKVCQTLRSDPMETMSYRDFLSAVSMILPDLKRITREEPD